MLHCSLKKKDFPNKHQLFRGAATMCIELSEHLRNADSNFKGPDDFSFPGDNARERPS